MKRQMRETMAMQSDSNRGETTPQQQPKGQVQQMMASMGERARSFLAWFKAQSRGMQTGVGCGGLIVACVVCSVCVGLAGAVGNGGNGNGGNGGSSSSSVNTSGQSVIATFGPTVTPQPPTATPKPKAWVTITGGHITGSASQQTETFHVAGQWRIVWACQANDQFGGGNFIVELHNASDGSYVDLIANTTGNGGQTYNAHTGDGDFYLKVDTFDELYSLDVQQLQ